jgi:hypothetical protein
MIEGFHQKNDGSDVNNSVYGLVICSAVVHKQRKLYSLIFLPFYFIVSLTLLVKFLIGFFEDTWLQNETIEKFTK